VARTDEGLFERRGLIAIDELVIFFDPSIPTSALSYGEEATAASTVSVESLLFFFLFRRFFSRIVKRSSFSARRRPRDSMPRGHVGASSILLLLFFLISCTRSPFVSCSPLFHLFLHFEERHEMAAIPGKSVFSERSCLVIPV